MEIVLIIIVLLFIISLGFFIYFQQVDKEKKRPHIQKQEHEIKFVFITKDTIPFKLAAPDNIVCAMYVEEHKLYCVFSFIYPEIHISLKFTDNKIPTNNELSEIGGKCFVLFMKHLLTLDSKFFLLKSAKDKEIVH